MRKSRRQFVLRILERVALALVLLDVALYFAMFRPIANLVGAAQQRYANTRRRIHEGQGRVERLEKFLAALPGADQKIEVFKRHHVPPRRRGFSRATRLVRRVTEQSGIQLSSVSYKLEPEQSAPLERLGIEINVEGSFPGLLKFAHALETASDFILIREFTFEAGESGQLALRLAADLYLTP